MKTRIPSRFVTTYLAGEDRSSGPDRVKLEYSAAGEIVDSWIDGVWTGSYEELEGRVDAKTLSRLASTALESAAIWAVPPSKRLARASEHDALCQASCGRRCVCAEPDAPSFGDL